MTMLGINGTLLSASHAVGILGPVDKPRPDADASEQDEPQEAVCELVISGSDAPLLLEMANEPKSGSCLIACMGRIGGTVGDGDIPASAFASPCG